MSNFRVPGAQQMRHRMAELSTHVGRQSPLREQVVLSPQALRGLAATKRREADAAARHLRPQAGYAADHPSAVAHRAAVARIANLRTQAAAFEAQANELEARS